MEDHISVSKATKLFKELLKREFMDMVQSSLNGTMNAMQEDFKILQGKLIDIKTSQQFLSDSFDDMKQQLATLRYKLDQFEKTNAHIETNTLNLVSIESRMDELEQQALENNLIISNLPERVDENVIDVVKKAVALHGHVLTGSEIIACNRMRTENKRGIKPILVKFSNNTSKRMVMSAINGKRPLTATLKTGPKVYANQHLTKRNQYMLNTAKEYKLHHGFSNVWFYKGAVYLKRTATSTPMRIENIQELRKL